MMLESTIFKRQEPMSKPILHLHLYNHCFIFFSKMVSAFSSLFCICRWYWSGSRTNNRTAISPAAEQIVQADYWLLIQQP